MWEVKVTHAGTVRHFTCYTADEAAWLVYMMNRLPDVLAEVI